LAIYKRSHLTANGNTINIYRRGQWRARLEGHQAPINILSVFGSQLLSVSSDNVLMIWNLDDNSIANTIRFPDDFTISAIVHPHTYLNKVGSIAVTTTTTTTTAAAAS
jgi:U3 small nucleolar RNA-associated protein 21